VSTATLPGTGLALALAAVTPPATPTGPGTTAIAALLVVGLLVGVALGGWLGHTLGRSAGAAHAAAAEREATAVAAAAAAERIAAEQRLADLRAADERQLADLRAEQARMVEQFQAVAAEVMRKSNADFLDLAEQRLTRQAERADGELARRQQAVEHLVQPLRDTLGKVELQLTEAERARTSAQAELRQQVMSVGQASDALRGETARLVGALRAPHVRGRWGELQLRRTVEAAGMVRHCDFVEQEHLGGDEGALRPDMVIKLPGGKNVVVDSKVPMNAWLDAQEAIDDAARATRLTAHARSLRGHVDALASKAYWERLAPTPELVVLFTPADAFLDAALREDAGLLEHAFARNVVIATPSTLVTLLRTVAYTWRQEALAENAQQVLTLGSELYARLAKLGEHLRKLGGSLTRAVDQYNDTIGSVETRVLVSARRLRDLHVADQPLAEIPPVTAVPRRLSAVELTGSGDGPTTGPAEAGSVVTLPPLDPPPAHERAG
jgi:DNA recombination protein RmuC